MATARRLVELYRAHADALDTAVRERVIEAWMRAEAYAALHLPDRVTASSRAGPSAPEASLNKIFWSEMDLEMHETAMSILGARAELLPEAPAAGEVGTWLDGFQFALAGPIYAGTNEIQRNVIAERLLGLPRK